MFFEMWCWGRMEKISFTDLVKNWRSRARAEPDGTRWRTGGKVKGKLAKGVCSQYSHPTSERGLSSITQADAHTSSARSRLNWRLHRFKWTRPFRGETKSGFCACAITFRTSYTTWSQGGKEYPTCGTANWIGHILRRNCLLKRVIEGMRGAVPPYFHSLSA